MESQNIFSLAPWTISSALCLAHYLYMTKSKSIVTPNKWSYPEAFALMVTGDKIMSLYYEKIETVNEIDHPRKKITLNALTLLRVCFIGISTLIPVLTYVESCLFLSKIPTKRDLGLASCTSLGMTVVFSLYSNPQFV